LLKCLENKRVEKMQHFATIASITNPKKELITLMRFISSKKFNRCNRSELLLKMRKPTVACWLSASLNLWLITHASRQTSTPTRKKEGRLL